MQVDAVVTHKVEVVQAHAALRDLAEKEAEFEFNIGARVHCQDGPWGKLVKVAVNPDTQQVTGLIVQKEFLLQFNQVLPLAVIESTTAEDVYLTISSDDLETYPEYREVEIREPALPDLEQVKLQSEEATSLPQVVEVIVPMTRRQTRDDSAMTSRPQGRLGRKKGPDKL